MASTKVARPPARKATAKAARSGPTAVKTKAARPEPKAVSAKAARPEPKAARPERTTASAEAAPPEPAAGTPKAARPGRNEPCPCGSGRKYKQCCLEKDEAADRVAFAKALEEAPEPSAEAAPARTRTPKHQTQQPWRGGGTRTPFKSVRMPRKVGGS